MIIQEFGKEALPVLICLNGMLGSGKTEKSDTSVEQSHEHAHNFLRHHVD
jgi:hypothetical protein